MSDSVPSQTYHDLFFRWSFSGREGRSGQMAVGSRFLNGLSIQLGGRNLFDQVPPLDVVYANNDYLSPYGDTRLRSYWLSLKRSF